MEIYDVEPNDLLPPSGLFTCEKLEVLVLNISFGPNYSETVLKDPDFKSEDDSSTVSEVYDYGLELPPKICLPSLRGIYLKNV